MTGGGGLRVEAPPRHAGDLVQPILVTLTGTHVETIHAAALASARSWLAYAADDDPTTVDVWWRWLSGPFTKTVRRVRRLPDPYVLPAGVRTQVVTSGQAQAMAFDPMLPEVFPRPVRRAQVAGTQVPPGGEVHPPRDAATGSTGGGLVVLVRDAAGMSTGKAAAQAAHAAMGCLLAAFRSGVPRELLEAAAGTLTVRLVDDRVFTAATGGAGWVVIRDAGRTEVDPGTVTAAGALT